MNSEVGPEMLKRTFMNSWPQPTQRILARCVRSALALGLAFLVLSAGVAWAKTPSSQRILQVEIRGNRNVNAAAIMARVQSRVDQQADAEVVDRDIKRIYAMGCFKKVIATAEPESGKAGGIKLVFTVLEKSSSEDVGCTR